jgi:hypothetical protein
VSPPLAHELTLQRSPAALILAAGHADTGESVGSRLRSVAHKDWTVPIGTVQSPMSLGLRDLPWGTVDCAPRVRAVIEQRDADGELLFRYAGYRTDPDPFEVWQVPSLVVGILCGVGSSTVVTFCTFALVTLMK